MAKIKSACLDGADMISVYLDSDNIIMLRTNRFDCEGVRPPWLTTDGESLYLPNGKRLTLSEILGHLLSGGRYG